MTNQSRRSFLQGSIVGAAALASASVVQAAPRSKVPVSYTHLTLPTICSV